MALELDPALDALTVSTLRRLFRGLAEWRSVVENTTSSGTGQAGEMDTLTDHDGNQWNIWDVEWLYSVSQQCLTPRQAQAIHYFLVLGKRERDVAELMGIDPENPIGMYATDGLNRILTMLRTGDLPPLR